MNQEVIKKEIIKLCGHTEKVSTFGWHFVHNDLHYFYVPDNECKFIRMIIPHIVKVNDKDLKFLNNVINETNREVKFVKVVILDNGSISISYDHKIGENENITQLVHHIIKTLDFAACYLKNKIAQKSI